MESMKLSELIKRLQNILDIEGDVRVVSGTAMSPEPPPVQIVNDYDGGDGVHVVVG